MLINKRKLIKNKESLKIIRNQIVDITLNNLGDMETINYIWFKLLKSKRYIKNLIKRKK